MAIFTLLVRSKQQEGTSQMATQRINKLGFQTTHVLRQTGIQHESIHTCLFIIIYKTKQSTIFNYNIIGDT